MSKLNYNDITKLEQEYQELYREALILKENPESEEYQKNKELRRVNIDTRIKLIRG